MVWVCGCQVVMGRQVKQWRGGEKGRRTQTGRWSNIHLSSPGARSLSYYSPGKCFGVFHRPFVDAADLGERQGELMIKGAKE